MKKSVGLARRCVACLLMVFALCGQALALEVPISQTEQNVDGKQLLTKVYEVSPDVDPETLKEDDFELNGFLYTLTSIVKEENTTKDTKTVTVQAPKPVSVSNNDYKAAMEKLGMTMEYDEDGYKGTLTLDPLSITITASGTKTNTKTDSITKTYTRTYNDDSDIPETVTENGNTYTKSSISWSDGTYSEDSSIPDNYVATVVYTRTYSYSTVTGYQATGSYTGEVTLDTEDTIIYTVQYTGTFIEPEVEEVEEPDSAEDADGIDGDVIDSDTGDEVGDENPEDAEESSTSVGVVAMGATVIIGILALVTSACFLIFKRKGRTDS